MKEMYFTRWFHVYRCRRERPKMQVNRKLFGIGPYRRTRINRPSMTAIWKLVNFAPLFMGGRPNAPVNLTKSCKRSASTSDHFFASIIDTSITADSCPTKWPVQSRAQSNVLERIVGKHEMFAINMLLICAVLWVYIEFNFNLRARYAANVIKLHVIR